MHFSDVKPIRPKIIGGFDDCANLSHLPSSRVWLRHRAGYPNLVKTSWTPLITKTGVTGAAGTKYGPYLQQAPRNPFTAKSGISAGTSFTAGASATDGWIWDDTAKAVFAVGFNEATGTYTAH